MGPCKHHNLLGGGKMKRFARSIVVIAVSALAAVWTPAAHAQTSGFCSFSVKIQVSPGLSTTPGSGVFTSGGETGTVECQGMANGEQPTGPGTLGIQGSYGTGPGGGTCAQDSGSGDFSATIPTTAGATEFVGTFVFAHSGPTGAFSATLGSIRLTGTIELVPTDGYCVDSPARAAQVTGRGALSETG